MKTRQSQRVAAAMIASRASRTLMAARQRARLLVLRVFVRSATRS
jgi:hypothetical protein